MLYVYSLHPSNSQEDIFTSFSTGNFVNMISPKSIFRENVELLHSWANEKETSEGRNNHKTSYKNKTRHNTREWASLEEHVPHSPTTNRQQNTTQQDDDRKGWLRIDYTAEKKIYINKWKKLRNSRLAKLNKVSNFPTIYQETLTLEIRYPRDQRKAQKEETLYTRRGASTIHPLYSVLTSTSTKTCLRSLRFSRLIPILFFLVLVLHRIKNGYTQQTKYHIST